MIVHSVRIFLERFRALDVPTQNLLRPTLRAIRAELERITSIEEINTDEFDIGIEQTDIIADIDANDVLYSIKLDNGYYLLFTIIGNDPGVCIISTIRRIAED